MPTPTIDMLTHLQYPPHGLDDPDRPWPLIVCLHGAGEVGHDLDRVRRQGLPGQIERGMGLPFGVAAPQSPETRWDLRALDRWLDEIVEGPGIDADRVYLTGYSMGGAATWDWATARPDRFAAIAPICGVGDPGRAHRLARIPVWAFHGELDRVVPPGRSLAMVEALRRAGGAPELTIVPDVGHDCWTQAYAEPALYSWFLGHAADSRRPRRVDRPPETPP